MKNVYIAGKMTGEECFNFERFFFWAHAFRILMMHPLNPAQIDCEKMLKGWQYTPDQYEAVLEYDLKLIREKADCIFMMTGWEDSKGATREHELAEEIALPIIYESIIGRQMLALL